MPYNAQSFSMPSSSLAGVRISQFHILPTQLAHPILNDCAVLIHPLRLAPSGRRQDGRQARCLFAAERRRRGMIVILGRSFGAEDARTPLDDVEIQLQQAISSEN